MLNNNTMVHENEGEDLQFLNNIEEFNEIPAQPSYDLISLLDDLTSGLGDDCGAGIFQKEIRNTSYEDYISYTATLKNNGFTKYVDNGREGLEHCVWNSTYTKDDLVVTVIYIAKRNRTYISCGKETPLSQHLNYSKQHTEQYFNGARTRIHMPELHTYGDSFIIQLKNGHFVMDDGGTSYDAPYLLDYLETLVPAEEKPVIEGWFISHGHGDHNGVFMYFVDHPEYADRICVNGVYFSEPSVMVADASHTGPEIQKGLRGIQYCKTVTGEKTPIYRPQTGQRYYFDDLKIDVLHTQEQLLLKDYGTGYGNNGYGFNDSSTWLLYSIEGQKFLHAGDAAEGSIEVVKSTYEQTYLDFDVMATFHHGQNVYECYVDYFNYKTVLYTTFVVGSQTAKCRKQENERLQAKALECMSYGDGTKILTFPYQIGTAESLPLRKWIYHPDRVPQKPY